MPKKTKIKFNPYYRSMLNCDGAEVFRNPSVALDGTDPKMSFKYIQDIFQGTIDDDVIAMVFSECAYDVDQAVETLMKLSAEDHINKPITSETSKNNENFNLESSNPSNQVNCEPNGDNSFLKYIGKVGPTDSFTFPEKNEYASVANKPKVTEINNYNNLMPENNCHYPNAIHPDTLQCASFYDPTYQMLQNSTVFNTNANTSSQPFLSSQYYKNSIPEFVTPFMNCPYKYTSPSPIKGYAGAAKSRSSSKNVHKKISPNKKFDENSKKDSFIRMAVAKIKARNKVLIIMRGLPGSGKSTLAKKLKHTGVVLSTDDFFMRSGKYVYDWTKLEEAHIWNKQRAEEALINGTTPVIIDNTNTEAWEMAPYIAMGRKYVYEILLLEPSTPWKFKPKELSLRTKHGVPKEKIIQMLNRYQHNINVDTIIRQLDSLDCSSKQSNVNTSSQTSQINNKEKQEADDLVYLEALVHQEDHHSDTVDNKGTYKVPNLLPYQSDDISSDCNSFADNLTTLSERDNDFDEDLAIKNLEDLKALIEVDSEESQSQSSNLSAEMLDSDMSCWVDITEKDDDFLWKEVSQKKQSFQNYHKETEINNKYDLKSKNLDLSLNTSKDTCKCVVNSDSQITSDSFKNLVFPKKLPFQEELQASQSLLTVEEYNPNLFCENSNSEKIEQDSYQITNMNVIKSKNENSFMFNRLSLITEEVTQSCSRKHMIEKEIPSNLDFKLNAKSSSLNNVSPTNLSSIKNISENLKNDNFDNDSKLSCSLPKSFPYISSLNDVPFIDYSVNTKENQSSSTSIKHENINSINKDSWDNISCNVSFSLNEENSNDNSLDEVGSERNENRDCVQPAIIENVIPKPQRFETKISNIFNNKNIPEKDSSNVLKVDDFEDWEIETCQEINKAIDHTENRSILMLSSEPKPQRKLDRKLSDNSLQQTVSDNDTEKNKFKNCSDLNETGSRKCSSLFADIKVNFERDWTFPDYVPDSFDEVTYMENKFIAINVSSSQTEPSDFVALHKVETGNDCASNYRVLFSSANKPVEVTNVIKKEIAFVNAGRFEKSTSTDDLIIESEKEEKLNYLIDFFPDISKDDLLHFLELCHGNETWLTNLLLDSGYKYNASGYDNLLKGEVVNVENNNLEQNSSHSKEIDQANNSLLHNLPKSKNLDLSFSNNFKNIISNDNYDVHDNPQLLNTVMCSENVPENIEQNNCCDSGIKEESDNSKNISVDCDSKIDSSPFGDLQLVLDPAFAFQLEELFGVIKHRNPNESLPQHQRTVQIDFNTAKLIHSLWKNGVENKPSIIISEPQSKKKKKKKMKSRDITPPAAPADNSMSLSEIMDMEYALELYKQDKLKKDTDFATKLKRQELYNLFPGADTMALDDIFESNNYSLKDSVKTLGEEWGEHSVVKQTKDSEKIEKQVENWNREQMFKEFENSDWSSWVYTEGNMALQDVIITPLASTISEEALELRRKATEHFNLRQEFIQKAKDAFCRGMKDVASFYSQKGSEHQQQFKEINKLASQLIIKQRNEATSAHVLDLHGLYVQEAIPRLEKFLRDWKLLLQSPQFSLPKTLSIITGQGQHSIRGPKLRPSVIEYLKRAGYRFSEVNLGVLEVTLCPE